MRRLMPSQPVRVDLDAKVDWDAVGIDCRVRTVTGPVAVLEPVEPVGPAVQTRLSTGAMCFLAFEHNRVPVALRGVTLSGADSESLEFVVVDGVQVAERRTAERTALVTGLRASPIASDGAVVDPVATVTSNLSMGGALLLRRPGLGDGPRWHIELFLPGEPEHVHCDAELARATPTHMGVKFQNMSEEDQLRLAALLARLRRGPAVAA